MKPHSRFELVSEATENLTPSQVAAHARRFLYTSPLAVSGVTERCFQKKSCCPMQKPERVQLKRERGWRMPPNTVKVDRTTKFGNPFTADRYGLEQSIA